MRSIVNISLPFDLKLDVETAVKKGGYATTSEFFRHLLRDWKAKELLGELEDSRKAIKEKKGKVL